MMTNASEELRVLHVDPDRSVTERVESALTTESADFEVVTERDPDAALTRLTTAEWDCLVTGYELPGMDGIDLLRVVRETSPELPVILFVADGTEAIASRAITAGATDYVRRGVESEGVTHLVDRVRAVVETGAAASESAVSGDRAYREVFENVSDGLVVHDPETGEILDVNQRYCEMNGYSREELLGASIGTATAPGEAYSEAAAQEMIEAAREEGPQLFEWRNEQKNGETFPVEVHLAVVWVGNRERVLASVRDITERKRREQKRQESERRLRLIANHIDEVIVLASEDFSETLYVNPAYEAIWGRPVEDLYDDPGTFVEAVDHRDREALVEEMGQMVEDLEQGTPADSYSFEYRIRRPNGDLRWVSSTGYAVELPDGTGRAIAVVEDITERKRREQRLEVFNRVLRHNLRNQLDVIMSHAEVLTDRADDHAQRIIAAANELSEMGARARATDQIMSTGDKMTEIDVPEALRAVVDSAASAQGVDVVTDLPESATLVTNDSALRTAVRSGLENTIDYADSVATLRLEDQSDELVVVIDGDGPGIPDGELVPIQVGTETDLQHARGLGLWQLRWSVDKLGGELAFDTTAGTTIRITIPDRSDTADRS